MQCCACLWWCVCACTCVWVCVVVWWGCVCLCMCEWLCVCGWGCVCVWCVVCVCVVCVDECGVYVCVLCLCVCVSVIVCVCVCEWVCVCECVCVCVFVHMCVMGMSVFLVLLGCTAGLWVCSVWLVILNVVPCWKIPEASPPHRAPGSCVCHHDLWPLRPAWQQECRRCLRWWNWWSPGGRCNPSIRSLSSLSLYLSVTPSILLDLCFIWIKHLRMFSSCFQSGLWEVLWWLLFQKQMFIMNITEERKCRHCQRALWQHVCPTFMMMVHLSHHHSFCWWLFEVLSNFWKVFHPPPPPFKRPLNCVVMQNGNSKETKTGVQCAGSVSNVAITWTTADYHKSISP